NTNNFMALNCLVFSQDFQYFFSRQLQRYFRFCEQLGIGTEQVIAVDDQYTAFFPHNQSRPSGFCWRSTSYISSAADTAAFRLVISPVSGIVTLKSHFSRVL